jgi:hypothetical protein
MRIVADSSSEDYFELKFEGEVKIFLDGRELKHVIMADDSLGTIEKFATDKDGNFVVQGDVVVTEFLIGNVKIEGTPRNDRL